MSTTLHDEEDSPTQPLPVLRGGPRSPPDAETVAALPRQPEQVNENAGAAATAAWLAEALQETEPNQARTQIAPDSSAAAVVPPTSSTPALASPAFPTAEARLEHITPQPQPAPANVTSAPVKITPAAFPAVAATVRQPARGISWLALAVAGISLLLNIIIIAKLLQVQGQVKSGVDQAIAQLEGMCSGDSPSIVFPISQTIRFQGEIPMPPGLVIPFKGNIPFNTTLRVEAFPGGPVINVPINTVVPVDTKVPIPGGIVIPVDTTIPFRQDIPIDLCTESSPFGGILRSLITELRVLQRRF